MPSSSDDSGGLAAALEAELDGTPGCATSQEDAGPAPKRPRPSSPSSSACPHPATMGGLCVACGAVVAARVVAAAGDARAQDDGVALRYIHAGLTLSAAEAARLAASASAAATAAGRLHLVLDLDHTLLNSTRGAEVPADLVGPLAALLAREERLDGGMKQKEEGGGEEEAQDAAADNADGADGAPPSAPPPAPPRRTHPGVPHTSYTSPRTLFHLPSLGLWTKLRPGCRPFLDRLASLFELSIYTHGDRPYADAMATILDPDASLFGDRVISGGDSTRAHAKSLDVVLGDDAATLILDDTRAVWPRHAANLLLVERYVFFPACAGRFGVGPSLLARATDEDGDRGMLAVAGRVLAGVHAAYFAEASARDVRVHLASARAALLAGCRVALSGVAPLGADARASPAARLAASLGAAVQADVDASTTHVVAAADGTAKANAGRAVGAAVVSPAWLDACLFTWARAPEASFPPPPPGAPRGRARPSSAADLAAAAAGAGRLGG